MRRLAQFSLTAASALLAGLLSSPAVAHEGDAAARLGKVHFKVECNAAAQQEFDLAMAYYHSFAWELYKAPLERTLAADPTCGMAHWLNALALLDNPFGWPVNIPPKVLDQAAALLDAARSTGLKSERERAYVDALAVFFKDREVLNHRTRAKALEEAMAQVAARYPGDTEATILYALVTSVNFDPTDKQYRNQLKAARLLEPIFASQPEHPGAAHYLIHSYDYPPLANDGLDAARRYAKIAPEAAHAQHMPSHIFTRVGDWQASVEANKISADSAKGSIPNRMHAYDYMVYAHLQQGQEKAAAGVIAQMKQVPTTSDNFAVAYGFAAMPARYALERRDWKEAASLPLYPAADAYPWSKHPQAVGVNAYARGIGAALSGDAAAARSEAERLLALRDAAAAAKFTYWVEQLDIQAAVVKGMATIAAGDRAGGLVELRKAADREDATEKHVVTPGPIAPARELLAYTLLDGGAAAEALVAFEKVMKSEPNRYRTLAGAAEAARKANDPAKARQYSARLLEIAARADGESVEITAARRTLGS
jgi:hypothetical protein